MTYHMCRGQVTQMDLEVRSPGRFAVLAAAPAVALLLLAAAAAVLGVPVAHW